MSSLISIAAWMLIHPCFAFADRPAWTKADTLKQKGSSLEVVCEGAGPSRDLARKFALDSCLTTAANQVNSDFKVTSLSLETEKSVNFHSEVSSEKTVTGLVCSPQAEYSEEAEGQLKVWIKCSYDLRKAKVVSIKHEPSAKYEPDTSQTIVNSKDEVSLVPSRLTSIKRKSIAQSETRSLSLTTVPRCDSVLVRGNRPRSIACDEMPVTLVVSPEDLEIIIRSSGYLPKHIHLTRRRPSGSAVESLEVYLEKN